MKHQVALFGMYAPSLIVCVLIAGLLWYLLDDLMVRRGFWRYFWHPPLARLSLYFVLLTAVATLYPDF